ncbi:patatin-like phospholipase family protein [Balneolaceae bacterium YR4-1]|uniref:Patatin-like phospholipase family protein n=2 Tax=Halalkalibaculum roseum TaxID=2709311 RepID=A0A6M1SSZ1_9BACT|nr:patatin-like phospholipase family protein [Halalkalibaculum roseum]
MDHKIMNNSKGSDGIGLALGSGAALGAAHIGVLKALEEHNIKPSFITGTSIGALVGALYAFGKSVEEIEEIAIGLDWLDISDIRLSKMGLLSNNEIGELLNEHLGEVTFEEANIKLAVVATDIANGEKVILDKGRVSEAVEASTCIPVIFEPIEIDGRMLVDGGLLESVPVSVLKDFGAAKTIAVDVKAFRKYKRPDDIFDVLNNSLEIALIHLAHVRIEDVDLLIQPKLGDYSRMDTNHTREMIDLGYEAAVEALDDF